jgi:hypothetical protein
MMPDVPRVVKGAGRPIGQGTVAACLLT